MRSRIQAQVFLGLFLIVFGLFAAQYKKKSRAPESKSTILLPDDPTPTPAAQNRIQVLYDHVAVGKAFSNRTGGVRLSPNHAPVKSDFIVTFYGDDFFTDQGATMHESWDTTLDFLAEIIQNEQGLHVEISGFADEENPKENKPTDYVSALAFSYARAEWLAHYFEHKHGISIPKTFILRGMGAVPQGKKVELRFFFGSV